MLLCFFTFFGLLQEKGYGHCHTFLVQVTDGAADRHLSEEESSSADLLAKQLKDVEIAAVYSSDELCAVETAQKIAQYHNLEVITDPALRTLSPGTLFQRIGAMRTFGVNLTCRHTGCSIVVVTHESLVNFVGRYTSGGFKKIPHFSFLEIGSDGRSMHIQTR